ncbi:hypothetical protein Tco_0298286 [Tanacetum coccineum]
MDDNCSEQRHRNTGRSINVGNHSELGANMNSCGVHHVSIERDNRIYIPMVDDIAQEDDKSGLDESHVSENKARAWLSQKSEGNVNSKSRVSSCRTEGRHFPLGIKTRCYGQLRFAGAAKRWVDRLAPGTINTWDLLSIRPFRSKKSDHILGLRPAEALTTIQTMADHSQKWHDDTTSMNIRSSSSKDGLVGCQNMRRVTTLAKEAVTKIDNNEDCKAIFTNDGAPFNHYFIYSPEEIEYFLANFGFSDDEELKNDLVVNKPLTMENEDIRINRRCSALIYNKLPPKEKDPGSFLSLPALRENWKIMGFEWYGHHLEPSRKKSDITKGCLRNNEIRCYWESENDNDRVSIEWKDLKEWFKGTSCDFMSSIIEGSLIDYLEPTSYDGFIDLDEEEYNKRRCRLLGMPYIAPLPLIIEQVKITPYSLGLG